MNSQFKFFRDYEVDTEAHIYERRWTEAARVKPDVGKTFKVMHWNILA